jgi:hypothetical protein
LTQVNISFDWKAVRVTVIDAHPFSLTVPLVLSQPNHLIFLTLFFSLFLQGLVGCVIALVVHGFVSAFSFFSLLSHIQIFSAFVSRRWGNNWAGSAFCYSGIIYLGTSIFEHLGHFAAKPLSLSRNSRQTSTEQTIRHDLDFSKNWGSRGVWTWS